MNVYDGDSKSAFMLGSKTGDSVDCLNCMQSTGSDILVNLVSDGSVVKSGFRIQYVAGKYDICAM